MNITSIERTTLLGRWPIENTPSVLKALLADVDLSRTAYPLEAGGGILGTIGIPEPFSSCIAAVDQIVFGRHASGIKD